MEACRGRESVKGIGEQSMDSLQPCWHMNDVVETAVAQWRDNKHSGTRALELKFSLRFLPSFRPMVMEK